MPRHRCAGGGMRPAAVTPRSRPPAELAQRLVPRGASRGAPKVPRLAEERRDPVSTGVHPLVMDAAGGPPHLVAQPLPPLLAPGLLVAEKARSQRAAPLREVVVQIGVGRPQPPRDFVQRWGRLLRAGQGRVQPPAQGLAVAPPLRRR